MATRCGRSFGRRIGERGVVTRLLWLANARFRSGSHRSTWLTLLLQFVHIAVLIALAWLLLLRTGQGNGAAKTLPVGSRASFAVACTVILNLMLSPFQMWNFVWSIQTMFALSFLLATISFLSLALAEDKNRISFVALAGALAAFGTFAMPNGLLVWPVLVLQALYLKRNRRVIAGLALIGTVAFGSYLWHYTRPDMGMGVGGMLRHPVQTILLVGAGCRGSRRIHLERRSRGSRCSRPWRHRIRVSLRVAAQGAGATLAVSVGRDHSVPRAEFDQHRRRAAGPSISGSRPAVQCSLPLSHDGQRALDVHRTAGAPHPLAPAGPRRTARHSMRLPMFYFMFWTARQQLVMAEDWADYFRATDALGAAFLLDAPDEEMLSHIWPARIEREERVAFLREKGLAMFHELRASWMGKSVADLFAPLGSGRCIGGIEKTTVLQGFARVQGWAWDLQSGSSPDYILLTDAAGRIIGQARGGMRHGYIPGLLIENGSVPRSHAAFHHSEWLGYVLRAGNSSLDHIGLLGVFANQGEVCAVR